MQETDLWCEEVLSCPGVYLAPEELLKLTLSRPYGALFTAPEYDIHEQSGLYDISLCKIGINARVSQ